MSQSLASIKIHVIFSTKSRLPFLTEPIRTECFAYLASVAIAQGSQVHEVGGMDDHVHMLISLPRTVTLSKIIEVMKTSSSKWLKTKGDTLATFSWQNGYGAFSVSASQVNAVRHYIRNQESHHKKATFQDELRAILKACQIVYDEKHLWN